MIDIQMIRFESKSNRI